MPLHTQKPMQHIALVPAHTHTATSTAKGDLGLHASSSTRRHYLSAARLENSVVEKLRLATRGLVAFGHYSSEIIF